MYVCIYVCVYVNMIFGQWMLVLCSTDCASSSIFNYVIFNQWWWWWSEGRVWNLYYNKACLCGLPWVQGVLTTRRVAVVIIQYSTTVTNFIFFIEFYWQCGLGKYQLEVSGKSDCKQALHVAQIRSEIIGASLSEPHTSVTALRTRVSIRLSIYGPTTYRKF